MDYMTLKEAKADWLIGINATRLFSILYHKTLNVGRVQTPTLAMLVNRDYAISSFKKEKYHVVRLDVGGVAALSERQDDEAAARQMKAACEKSQAVCTSLKKEKKTAKRTSIRKQFAGIFIGLMAGTILLCWFLNSGFLQKYYISNKKAVLMRMYEELGEAVANGEIDTDEYQLSLQQQCSKYNLSLLVLNANSEVVADSGGGSEFLKQQLLQHLFALSGEKYEIMENGNNYIVARVSDSRAQMEYIESWGILTGGYFFIVRSALEGIRDSAKIANTFLASVGIFSAIISGIVIWIVSRRVTTPVSYTHLTLPTN